MNQSDKMLTANTAVIVGETVVSSFLKENQSDKVAGNVTFIFGLRIHQYEKLGQIDRNMLFKKLKEYYKNILLKKKIHK